MNLRKLCHKVIGDYSNSRQLRAALYIYKPLQFIYRIFKGESLTVKTDSQEVNVFIKTTRFKLFFRST